MSSAIEEEEEILLSIFPDEFEKVNDSTFRIRIDIDPSECKVKSPPTMYLIAQLPPTYPDTPPILHIESLPSEEGTDLSGADKDALLGSLTDSVQENLGMAMVFTLVSALKEHGTALLDDRVGALERAQRDAKLALEREEQKRFEGTKVTAQSFAAWNANFKLEQLQRQADEEEAARAKAVRAGLGHGEKKLTGRQLFEGDKTLAQSDLKIGEATDVEFDFSKFDRTTRSKGDEEDDEEEETK
ncbi:Putative uncharacterized protein [Taphrina deformans PYCC 5710]|uniref:RWD domain-containing protein n=1 Tax=Taphrina deformans (strain PYCC 5710 / ATCC 11124 / CBS 356.35 / IMI 108563 / JCM 9778 / NBRC 8474) TaxID=1097556 RepID=R5A399_TAPDE|nr:Putative uncharacterized protein [Taphrina deformans PYCC 5710]|eukprot:CCX35415.1 Putative uncharacterized protein [Taphrina deformans PYCC 5710]